MIFSPFHPHPLLLLLLVLLVLLLLSPGPLGHGSPLPPRSVRPRFSGRIKKKKCFDKHVCEIVQHKNNYLKVRQ